MKNFILACAISMALLSCNNKGSNTAPGEGTKTNAAPNDSTTHPDGMTNGSAISTDTGAMKPHTGQHE